MEERKSKLSRTERKKQKIDNIIKLAFSKSLHDGLLLSLYLKCKMNPECLSQLRITDLTFRKCYIKLSDLKIIEIPGDLMTIFENFAKQKPGYVFELQGDPILPGKIEDLYQSYQIMYDSQYLDKFKDILLNLEQKTKSEHYTIKLKQIKRLFVNYYGIMLSSSKVMQLIEFFSNKHNIPIQKIKSGYYRLSNSQFQINHEYQFG